jgi:hypothetical protein
VCCGVLGPDRCVVRSFSSLTNLSSSLASPTCLTSVVALGSVGSVDLTWMGDSRFGVRWVSLTSVGGRDLTDVS